MKTKLLTTLIVGSIFLHSAGMIHAEGESLSIFPPIIEIQTTPPSSPFTAIQLTNNNTEDITLEIQLIPFKTSQNTGEVTLMPEEATKGLNPFIINRIQFLVEDKKTENITLEGLQTKEIILNLNLQKGDPTGDFYYSIVFMTPGKETNEGSSSQIPAGIATNLLLSIGPKEKVFGGISEFSTKKFMTKGPVDFTLKLHNGGKHLVIPEGKIAIENMLGKQVGSVDILPQYVLAGSDRLLINDLKNENATVRWNEKFLFGFYKATASIRLEENGTILKQSTTFFAFPLSLFFPMVGIIFIILSIYIRVRRKIK